MDQQLLWSPPSRQRRQRRSGWRVIISPGLEPLEKEQEQEQEQEQGQDKEQEPQEKEKEDKDKDKGEHDHDAEDKEKKEKDDHKDSHDCDADADDDDDDGTVDQVKGFMKLFTRYVHFFFFLPAFEEWRCCRYGGNHCVCLLLS